MKKVILLAAAVAVLAGCQTEKSRLLFLDS